MVSSVAYNPLHGPRLAVAVIVLCAAAVLARGADQDRDRAARVALALAGSAPGKPAVAVAPMPRPKLPLLYSDGYAKAADEEKPLVVFVGCPGDHGAPGAIVSRAETFADVVPPAVVVGYPVGDRLFVHATLPCPVPQAKLDAAGAAASKKINDPPARAMPAPAPVDWVIRADAPAKLPACGCGDRCGCPGDKCGACAAKGNPRDSLVRVKCGDGSGSGTVVWSDGNRSLVLTAAHVLTRGRESLVRAEGKWHRADVLASDAGADLAALLVAAALPAAAVAENDPAADAEVLMYGVTSLWSKGRITGGMVLDGRAVYTLGYDSDSGDSGGGVFAGGRLVGVHCGKVGESREAARSPYCTAAGPVRKFLAGVLKADGPKAVAVAPPKGDPKPADAPKAADTLVIGGTAYTRGADGVYRASGAAAGCPNGRCPVERPAPRYGPQYK